jgi:hypothetical protein
MIPEAVTAWRCGAPNRVVAASATGAITLIVLGPDGPEYAEYPSERDALRAIMLDQLGWAPREKPAAVHFGSYAPRSGTRKRNRRAM